MIQIDFEITSSDGLNVYKDALYLEDDHSFTDEEIEAMKQQRFDNWIKIITTPIETTNITEELIQEV